MLYHASATADLKVLEPHVSTHGKAYVYAIKSRLTAMLFGVTKDDFDFLMDEKKGITFLYECYPDALKRVYEGKACSVYTVSEDGFLTGQTGWAAEFVNPMPVEVVCEEKIEDIYGKIMEAADRQMCVIHSYEESEDYLDFLRRELQERVRLFGLTEEHMRADFRFEKYFKDLFVPKPKLDDKKLKLREKQLNCTFCEEGRYAEMILDISGYEEKTRPIQNIDFRFFTGDAEKLKKAVASVREDWVQYFKDGTCVFCGYEGENLASFCIVDEVADCILDTGEKKVGAIGCVGTVPDYRKRGIGLRMVDLATVYLKNKGCKESSISYTHIDNWYKKLGYQTYARFSVL